MEDGPDFSVDSYNIDDLLSIFGITEPTTRDKIMEVASRLMDQYRQQGRPQYVEFFSKAANRLLSGYASVQEALSKGKEVLDKVESLVDAGEDLVKMSKKEEPAEPGENMMQNEIFMDGGISGRAAEQLPNRRNNVSVLDDHGTQAQRRLLIPNAFANLPFVQGSMNPSLRNYHLTWINIDSQYREILSDGDSTSCSFGDDSTMIRQMDTSTDFTFLLSEPITNVMALTVGTIEIPISSYYTFSKRYGTTSFEIEYDNSHNCVIIPDGNYTAQTLMEVINNLLASDGYPVRVFIDPSTQKTAVAVENGEVPAVLRIVWYSEDCGLTCDISSCHVKNTGGKMDSNLGWLLGFRQPIYDQAVTNTEPIADASLNEWAKGDPAQIGGTWLGIQSESTFNQFGTKYMILEVDDFNKNRNSGNMSTLTNNREKFKLPDYFKKVEASFPVCVEHCASIGFKKGKHGPNMIPRACRRGTPNPNPIIDGSNNMTHAQKYTAAQIMNAQKTLSQQRYFAPTASNVLLRFPIHRISPEPHAPLVIENLAGLDNARTYFGPTRIKRLRVRLLDDKGYPVDLASDFSFSLLAQQMYQY